MEVRRCVRRSRDAHRRSDGQGQEHEEEHGKEAGSKDAEREAAGQEGEEVAGPRAIPEHWPTTDLDHPTVPPLTTSRETPSRYFAWIATAGPGEGAQS